MNISELMFLRFEDWLAVGFIEGQLICQMLKMNESKTVVGELGILFI